MIEGLDLDDLEPIGAGQWSRAYGLGRDRRDLVLRLGRHVHDFEKDRCAAAFARPGLPVPEVLEIGQWDDDDFFALSVRARGDALEARDWAGWRRVLPSVLEALDAMRTIEVPGGWGTWLPSDGLGIDRSWREHLMAIGDDPPEARTHGWRARLSPEAAAAFDTGMHALDAVADVYGGPPRVVHRDLINRNVLVDDDVISAVFDWGCSVYGDPLYDVAWFEFWAPWYPAHEYTGVVDGVRERWDDVDFDERLRACALHIGLDHIGYNTWLNADGTDLRKVVERTLAYVGD